MSRIAHEKDLSSVQVIPGTVTYICSANYPCKSDCICCELKRFAATLQGMCFHFKRTRKRGTCLEVNGRYCTFCELSDELDRILGAGERR
jgi:hypothetical protein